MNKTKTRIIKLIMLSAAVITAAFLLVLVARINSDRQVEYDYLKDAESVSNYSEVLRVAGGSDFSPFSYIDSNGVPSGHDVELAVALGRKMKCRVEVTLGEWTEMQAGILDGTYDVLITVDYSDDRSKIMGYTSPVCLDSYVFFGKDNLDITDFSDIRSLQGLKIAALDGGGATDNYLKPMNLLANTKFYDTQIDAFKSVEDGINDVAIAGYIYGSNIIGKLDMHLKQVGSPLYGSAYYFTYNIKNKTLGPRLNAALGLLESSGELTQIEEKWTTHYQPNLTIGEYIKRNLQSVLIYAALAVMLLLAVTEIIIGRSRAKEKNLLEKNQLTGLYNMHAFLKRMETILRKNPNERYIVIRFDIDNFKTFNATQGIDAGDRLLHDIGKNLQSKDLIPDIVLPGYLGADHYILLVQKGVSENGPEEVYNYLMGVLEKAFPGYYLDVRMGLCEVDAGNEDLAKYCDRALLALRSVKNDYYRHWAWYDKEIQITLDAEKNLTDKMHKALKEKRFVPYFQPQYDYKNRSICGVEVLTRWVDEDGTLIKPAEFMSFFEKNGFIYEMDKSIWQQSFSLLKKWKESGILPASISVNISRAEIYHRDLVETIQRIAEETDIKITDVHFEITESSYIENSKLLIETISKLKELGAYIEMDDFGAGYSSLSSLKVLDVDLVKLDMSLIADNTLEGKDAMLLKDLVGMINDMGLDMLAEGVEKENQAEFLSSIGCSKMQGFLFSKPLSAEDFEKYLKISQ